ncbi:pentapeptide repeat-containing protein [Actinoplanes subtropicus]|uniref:pentapeptide repeat-containing protein n=1 Tax=Actinoplanes subtropicus TaxID=543632 RepID=UPI0004C40646|nr:pentapeptide repeat-containing protein [Actinoplanes subtropicus]
MPETVPDQPGVAEAFARLLTGRPVGSVRPTTNGRVDLRDVTAPRPEDVAALLPAEQAADVAEGLLFENVRVEGVDFSGARLDEVGFIDAQLENCRFDRCVLTDFVLLGVAVTGCSFDGADLRRSGLGGWSDSGWTRFSKTSFRGADMRHTGCVAASFTDVDFSHARLEDVDFMAVSFVRCTFAGPLRRVIFQEPLPGLHGPDVNPMEEIDFSGAALHFVEFRKLELDRVRFPEGNEHVVVHHYPCVLQRASRELGLDDPLGAVAANQLRWAHPRRKVGIWHRDQLGETEAERDEAAARLLAWDEECAREL